MKLWLSLLLIATFGLAASAQAEVGVLRQEGPFRNTDYQVETIIFTTENSEDVAEVSALLQKMLREDQISNPKLKPYFEVITAEEGRSPNAEDPSLTAIRKISGGLDGVDSNAVRIGKLTESDLAALRKVKGNWLQRNAERLTFAFIRGSINGAATFAGLVASKTIHLPMIHAAAVSTLTAGIMCGLMMYHNHAILEWLEGNAFAKNIKNSFLKKTETFAEPYARWWMLEAGFLGIFQTALVIAGAPLEHSILTTALLTSFTALKTVFSQGLLDVAVGKDRSQQLAPHTSQIKKLQADLLRARENGATFDTVSKIKTDLEFAEKAAKKVDFMTNLKTLGISAFSVGTAIADIAGLQISNWGFGTMALAGVAYSVKLAKPEWFCRRSVNKPTPARAGEENAELIVIHDPKAPKTSSTGPRKKEIFSREEDLVALGMALKFRTAS